MEGDSGKEKRGERGRGCKRGRGVRRGGTSREVKCQRRRRWWRRAIRMCVGLEVTPNSSGES